MMGKAKGFLRGGDKMNFLINDIINKILDHASILNLNEYFALCLIHNIGEYMMKISKEAIKQWHHDIYTNGISNLFNNIEEK